MQTAIAEALDEFDQLYARAAACSSALATRTGQQVAERMHNLCRGLVAKLFIEIARCDGQWGAGERQLAVDLIARYWGRSVAIDEVENVLDQFVPLADRLSWGSLVAPFRNDPALADLVGELLTVVARWGNLVAKLDGQAHPRETQRLQRIQQELDVHLKPIPLDSAGDGSASPGDEAWSALGGSLATQGKPATAHPAELSTAPKPPPLPQSPDERLAAALHELDSLIGLQTIRQEMRQLVNFLRLQREREQFGLPRTEVSLHAVFEGNPGTGKTTVARLVGRILGALGILAKGHLVETDRAGLVAAYAGQTAIKTNKLIDQALDGVLFIDEAYSLVADQGQDAYGAEALQALLKRMEDDRRRLVVILAGYPEPMERLLSTNPGLKSRFQRRFVFPDYSAAELGQIFEHLCQHNHYVLPGETRLRLLMAFQYLLDRRDQHFGNGRLARNGFEQAIRRLANRIAHAAPVTRELLTTICPDDIALEGVPDELLAAADPRAVRLRSACPGCGEMARFDGTFLGRRVRCKRCSHSFSASWGEPEANQQVRSV